MRLHFSSCSALAWLIAVCVLFANSEPVQAAKTFRWKMAQGDRFQVEMKQTIKQVITIGDRTVEVPNDTIMQMTWLVDSAADGTFSITQTFDRIKMSMKGPTGDMEYDSASTEEPTGLTKTISDMLKPMIGAKFTQTMDVRGKVLDVKVPVEALKGFDANPLMKQFFASDSMKEMITKASPVLPDEAVDKGYRWQNKAETKTPVGKMTIDSSYVYDGEEQRDGRVLDKFSVSSTVGFADEPGGLLGAKIKVTDQQTTGTMYFDAVAGRFVENRVSQKLTMEVTVGTSSVNQKLESTVEMTVKPAP
jgi:hypothetical protein